jgi:serine/threonine protein kinase
VPESRDIESQDGHDGPDGLDGFDGLTEIGRGGFGTVYRAHQAALNRYVAIKVLSSPLDDSARERFTREGLALGSLTGHPNVVPVLAAGVMRSGRPYIVMPYVTGGSLADRLAGGPLPWPDVTAIGIRLAGAVETAHRAGIVHRDIKPANILFSAYDEPQLADFGIARFSGAFETVSRHITASLAHAAPETLDGDPPGPAADIYSLGSTLYTLLTGRPAFVHGEPEALVAVYVRIARDPIPDLRPLGVPDRLCATIEQAMAKAPSERQESAAILAGQLQEVQRDAALPVTPVAIASPRPPKSPDSPFAPVPRTFPAVAVSAAEETLDTPLKALPEVSEAPPNATAASRARPLALIGTAAAFAILLGALIILRSRSGTGATPRFRCDGTVPRCSRNSGIKTAFTLTVANPAPPAMLTANGENQADLRMRVANIGKSPITTSHIDVLVRSPADVTLAPYSTPAEYGSDWTCISDPVTTTKGLALRCRLLPRKGSTTLSLAAGEDAGVQFSVTASRPGRYPIRADLVGADFRPMEATTAHSAVVTLTAAAKGSPSTSSPKG